MRAGRRRRRLILAALSVPLVLSAAFFGYRWWWTSNFGEVQPGRIYRSAQMTARDLRTTIRSRRIKTVLNLRGVNLDQPWYPAEREATTSLGATQVDLKTASDMWLSRGQLQALIQTLDTSEYPLLIHCQQGSERTGLAVGVAELLRPRSTLREANAAFSLWYLFYRKSDNTVLPAHLEQYEAWLKARGFGHTPDRFRLWAAEGFVPGKPSREYWPFNPDPLVVVTRPGPSQPALGAGASPGKARR